MSASSEITIASKKVADRPKDRLAICVIEDSLHVIDPKKAKRR